MNKVIKIAPSPAHVEKYKALLRSDWTEKTLIDSVDLARKVVATSGFVLIFEWEHKKEPSKRNLEYYPIPPAGSDYLKEFLGKSNAGLTPAIADNVEVPKEKERAAKVHLAYASSVLLTLQTRDAIEDSTGLFRDIQSLLYLQCVEVMLPLLKGKSYSFAHDFLVNALFAHARTVWVDDPSHQQFLLCKFFEYVGERKMASRLLEASINNTSPADHEFITKVQMLWSIYLDESLYDRAKDLLLNVYRRANEKDLPELTELIELTIERKHRFPRHRKTA